jgi:anti-sigma regulatory factor (Ser/Thr protein kinase)
VGTAAVTTTRYQKTFYGQPEQVAQVRRQVAAHLDGCPVADDVILIVSEFATNAVLHSDSRDEFFTVRCQRYPDYVWIEVEDLGGTWIVSPRDGDRSHGLDIVEALSGADNWGVELTPAGDRVCWARLEW